MQDVLTIAIEVLVVGFAGLMVAQFATGLLRRNRYRAAEVEQAAVEANLPDCSASSDAGSVALATWASPKTA